MEQIHTVKMPDIGEGVVEGEVVDWLKKEGDSVSKDEPVVVVMTDKATVELPSPYQGKIVKHYYQVGQTAVKDHPLYDIELSSDVKITTSIHEEGLAIKKEEVTKPLKTAEESVSVITKEGEALAVPFIRKMAKDLGIDLSLVPATGKRGEVTEWDLKAYVATSKEGKPQKSIEGRYDDDEELPLVGVRHFMVKKMAESHEHIPPFSYFEQVDATHLIQLRERTKEEAEQQGIRLTFMPFFIRALSLTIRKFPMINSSLDSSGKKLLIHKHHHIGLAMAIETGLIVPVLRDVQDLKLVDIVKQYDELKRKAQIGKLDLPSMKGATITISNYGVLGVGGLWATPIINFPEVAILAVARIQKQPVVKENQVVAKDILDVSWSFDHRVIDGELGASVSHYFNELIKNPAQLL